VAALDDTIGGHVTTPRVPW